MTHDRDMPHLIRLEIRRKLKQPVGAKGSSVRRIQLGRLGYDMEFNSITPIPEEKPEDPVEAAKKRAKKKSAKSKVSKEGKDEGSGSTSG